MMMENRRFFRRTPLWFLLLVLGAVLLSRVAEKGSPGRTPLPSQNVVERVVDGDTVVLAGGERLRYIGVDTPELHHPRKPVERYAREAKEFNRRLVEGKKVRLEWDAQRRDRYQRLLAYVFLEDGTFVNAELIRQGYAHVLTIPPNVKYADQFVRLQTEAREAKRGLWGKR